MKLAPTLVPPHKFNPSDDVNAIKKGMKGGSWDSGVLMNLFTKRGMLQRAEIVKAYKNTHGRDLVDDIKKGSSGDVELLLTALTRSYYEYYACDLVDALDKVNVDETAILELLLPRFNGELRRVKKEYQRVCGRCLADDVADKISGDTGKLVNMVVDCSRSEAYGVDEEKAEEQAKVLYNAGEKKLGTDEAAFINLFATESFDQLNAISKHYQKLSDKSLCDAVKSETSGDFCRALTLILEFSSDRLQFYADSLYRSIQGVGTDERTLCRIVIMRSELDLAAINTKFEQKHKKTLEAAIEGDTSGVFKQGLLNIVRHH